MQVRTRHTPSFGVARLVLAPSEVIQTSASVLSASSYGVGVEKAQNTPLKSLAKTWRDATVFTAPPDGGWVDAAAPLPGDLYVQDLDGSVGWCLLRTGWLAAASTVVFEANWPGFYAMFGGDVGFLVHASGTGPLVLNCCGAVDVVQLAPGELITVDPGHVVAYPDAMQCRLRSLHPTGPQSVRTGEGLVIDFAGPGQLIMQTHSPRLMVNWLAGRSPDGRI